MLFDGGVIEGFEEIEVEIPDLAAFDTFEVEIEQRCPNEKLPEPGNCGAWDYLAHLSVYEAEPPAEGENPKRIELGRFITTYHREAHWVHDLSEMLPELDGGGTRKLRWEWAPEWNKQPTATWVTLRFSNRGKATRPSELIWLYGGGGFNAGYNEAHPPLEIAVPADAVKVELYVTISGHGMDQSNCAEFCNHVHEWTVNGEKFTESHGTVGQQDGCVQELENQMTPNQYGTWWFGRGGWCPGQPVMPWIVDVTDIVTPSEVADIHYQGFLNGGPPPDNSGNINMTSWLVVSK